MNEITLNIISQPGNGKAEFLATLEPVSPHILEPITSSSSRYQEDDLPFEITLTQYTRESWSSYSSPSSSSSSSSRTLAFCDMWMKSTDEKKHNKVSGFLQYLVQRQKAAYGIFTSPRPDPTTGKTRVNKALFIIPFDPPPFPSSFSKQEDPSLDTSNYIFVRYCLDGVNQLLSRNPIRKNDSHTDHPPTKKQQQQYTHTTKLQLIPVQPTITSQEQQQHTLQSIKSISSSIPSVQSNNLKNHKNSMMNGFLGKLVSKQEKTQHILSTVITPLSSSTSTKKRTKDLLVSTSTITATTEDGIFQTAQQVIQAFRLEIQEKLQIFQQSIKQTSLLIPISLGTYTRKLSTGIHYYTQEISQLTMDVFKFIIYEQVEEILDESYIAVVDTESTQQQQQQEYSTTFKNQEVEDGDLNHNDNSSSHHHHGMYLDEIAIRVYKPGYAPTHVMEEWNIGELPQEMKRQNQGYREAKIQEYKKRLRVEEEMGNQKLKLEHCMDEACLESLDQKKRDRRTMEEIQRDIWGQKKPS